MDFRKVYGFNKSKAEYGTWVDLDEGVRVKVGKIGSLAYNKAFDKAIAKYRTKIRLRQTLSLEENTTIAIQVYADAVLLDWQGVELDGQSFPYSREHAVTLMTEFPDFRMLVEAHANDPDLFQDVAVEEDSKNL